MSAAFFDARCGRCHARIGWHGTVLDHPGCPRCGWQPDQENLQADHEEMMGFRELMAELRQANPGWEKWRMARASAGLSLRQAAKRLEISPTRLSEIECCVDQPSEELAVRMIRCYGGDP